MVLSEIFRGNNEVREAARAGVQIDTVSVASASDAASAADGSGKITGAIRPPAVAGSFYPADRTTLKQLITHQLDYSREVLQQLEPTLPAGVPKAVIVPHAGYVYSGTAAALAYALLERGRGSVTRAVIVGPTHRVAVRGVACSTAAAFETPLGTVPVDIAAERKALGLSVNEPLRSGTHARPGASAPAMIVNGPTHAQEHAVEVQIPFLQTVLGPDLTIVPLNAGDATPQEAGDVLRALWGGPETVIVISSDLSHYHPHEVARALDDQTIADIAALHLPIHPRRACGAYPINGLLDVLKGRKDMKLFELGCSTSGDDGVVALAGQPRPAMRDADEPVVGYVSFAAWESKPEADAPAGADDLGESGTAHGDVLLKLARAAIRERLHIEHPTAADSTASILAANPWLNESGACFVTLTEGGLLRGCIGSLAAHRSLGKDIAAHAVDAATHDPRFNPVTAAEYPLLNVEISVLGEPEPITVNSCDADSRDTGSKTATLASLQSGPQTDAVKRDGSNVERPVRSRTELEEVLRPGKDGLILADRRGRSATFLPQVWDELPNPHDFVAHLLAKAGIRPSYDWNDGEIDCQRYEVTAYAEH
ncbi:AmmeMemoRadiSam system protein B [Bifidobacterium longum]|uniref:AmmeMemoRadiSam system protein B n=1 Tax=Bifidobacterium longum subsp. longum TaxID=1679 RepID=A0A9Q8QRY3_BIFLL|nr:AmmeMemoRadiSam system protein B [Bifidobacterium longum]UNL64930.1 AmmeMemoRadiSam system protein B [Bifidobacterium longum subsp. longum]UNL66576.1 AmmeMemoRadiSam system protein B [Bifidobacterium longum subsp. longum]UNL68719.1 AmmeMemoRadiSam system protein B [Bifidobacterium longum subsp. longum]UNL72010.1 AmmeMemoRadiSam system protein B [Bifidobacterium longum subsp. longum]UNL81221.1 AmmeMemoRadiSam system protein B [Bifidobacterium longum subsp. longum]